MVKSLVLMVLGGLLMLALLVPVTSAIVAGDGSTLPVPPDTVLSSSGSINLDPADYVYIANGKGLVVGWGRPLTAVMEMTPAIQFISNSGSPGDITLHASFRDDPFSGDIIWLTSRAMTPGDHKAVTWGQHLGMDRWVGDDGETYRSEAIRIVPYVDGPVSSGVVPGAIDYYLTDRLGTLRLRWTLDSKGQWRSPEGNLWGPDWFRQVGTQEATMRRLVPHNGQPISALGLTVETTSTAVREGFGPVMEFYIDGADGSQVWEQPLGWLGITRAENDTTGRFEVVVYKDNVPVRALTLTADGLWADISATSGINQEMQAALAALEARIAALEGTP